MRLLLSAAFLAAILTGCQTYDFEPVQPLALAQTTQSTNVVARQLKPNLMLLVDKSGSMDFKIDSMCSTNCATRMTELKSAMQTFLTSSGAVARMGLAFFPTKTSVECDPTDAVEVPLPPPAGADDAAQDSVNQANANTINTQIQGLPSPLRGGTPTGQSLRYVGGLPSLNEDDQRQDFVLLLTDGLPNCNPSNANDCTNPTACSCTLQACTTTNNYCVKGCLDRAGVVQNIQDLRAKSIRTIVVGFGADTAQGDAPDTLNAMAEAGGFARACKNGTDAECGGVPGSCIVASKICQRKFYQAANGTELATALADISASIAGQSLCVFALESQPSDPRFLAVIVDGVNQPPGPDTWQYSAGNVTFQGATCQDIQAATPSNPVKVEIRIVEKF